MKKLVLVLGMSLYAMSSQAGVQQNTCKTLGGKNIVISVDTGKSPEILVSVVVDNQAISSGTFDGSSRAGWTFTSGPLTITRDGGRVMQKDSKGEFQLLTSCKVELISESNTGNGNY